MKLQGHVFQYNVLSREAVYGLSCKVLYLYQGPIERNQPAFHKYMIRIFKRSDISFDCINADRCKRNDLNYPIIPKSNIREIITPIHFPIELEKI